MSHWLRRGRWVLAGVGLMAVGAIVAVILLGNSNAKGTIEPTVVASQVNTGPGTVTLRGKYVTLQYSTKYTLENSGPGDTSAVEQYVLTAATNYTKTAAIIVTPLPPGGLSDDSGYKARSLQPQTFTATTEQVQGQTVHLMAQHDGSQLVAYLTHNNLECSIALATALPAQDNLSTEMAAILQSFHWNS